MGMHRLTRVTMGVPNVAELRAALGIQDRTGGLGFLLDDAVDHERPTWADRVENVSSAR